MAFTLLLPSHFSELVLIHNIISALLRLCLFGPLITNSTSSRIAL